MDGSSSISPRHRYRRVGTATAPLVIDVRPEDDVNADMAMIAVAS
jgi:hypothetical protein